MLLTEPYESDRTRAYAEELHALVPARWFGLTRYDGFGLETERIALGGDDGRLSTRLENEYLIQSPAQADTPRVTDTRIDLDGMHGLTLIFGIDERIFGLALAIRARAFSALERETFRAQLSVGSNLLRRLATFEGAQGAVERTAERALPAQYVLNREFHVELRWLPPGTGADDAVSNILELSDELPPIVADTVRELTADWTGDVARCPARSAVPMPFMIVRTAPLRGPGGTVKIGVTVERYRPRNPLRLAADKFGMSSREIEVLALVLEGRGTPEIAQELSIAESTAHDHIKRMLLKSRSRNRVELAAKALGWRGA